MISTPGETLSLLWIGGHVVPASMVIERRHDGAICDNGRMVRFGFGESWDNLQAPPYLLAAT
ncbi:hypothetical protein KITKAT_21 [Arthrobacter phage Kitkat]|uniref:Uncharacterized protein n=3 Tax=Kelleziovirus TaxID=1982236 RepID=A0A140G6A5_9CAUD|nr:hypothetical protein BJD78_gp20 [Arthrobacter phage KellEzio]YP_009303304.1 hypothetical protein BJD77_gp021 [Arthrobacter phage Kitkat]AMM44190.1 hypothetical protein KELLEZIO_20 [Arthrobacter phage KellEzio]AMM44283.1 hypothetical protein KITKAT_21 [Arthrobacter phage Kitkat]QGJ96459.1 hypothetical protein SEA_BEATUSCOMEDENTI_20 [Arthrobacter phage BeatusComedenti]